MVRLTRTQVNSWRLSKNHIAQRAPKGDMPRVVSDVCGVQAQVLSGAALAICARVKNITIQDVQDALWKHRTLVKTWCMRGTLHLLSSSDLPLYVATLKTRQDVNLEKIPYRIGPTAGDKQYQITQAEQEQVTRAIHNALDQRTLTREELAREIVKYVRLRPLLQSHLLSGFGSLLQQAAHRGSLIFGPSQGSKVTFARPDQWLGKWDEPTREDAIKTLVQRFFTTYGPATHQDFGHWWGAPPPTARKLVASIADELEEIEFDGHRSWMRTGDVDKIQSIEEAGPTRLLPSWDPYVMFYHPRELFVPQAHRARIFRQIQGNAPVLLVDGIPAGTWEKTKKKAWTDIAVRPFKALSSTQKRAVEEEAEQLRGFFGNDVRVSFNSSQTE